jgi:A/G-specific adenine glycosylase
VLEALFVTPSSLPPAQKLLSWYHAHRRHLPWRSPPGERADPYHVWLSEIMLQQTVVATVIPYYAKFLAAYPTVQDLAKASVDDVTHLWAGLGYYSRARNLHACARQVAALGGFPRDYEGLRALPGIGPYTAAAIGAIAFSLPLLPVDGNIERVAARIFGILVPLPGAKPVLAKAAQQFLQDKVAVAAPGDFAQALFDLGATVCTPRNPNCGVCPWAGHCLAQAQGIAASLPARAPKKVRPHRTGTVYVLLDGTDNVFLRRRPPSGLLGGMLEVPDTPPVKAEWQDAGTIDHVFTHFSLTLTVLVARVKNLPAGGEIAPAKNAGLPSVMRKALDAGRRALKDSE